MFECNLFNGLSISIFLEKMKEVCRFFQQNQTKSWLKSSRQVRYSHLKMSLVFLSAILCLIACI